MSKEDQSKNPPPPSTTDSISKLASETFTSGFSFLNRIVHKTEAAIMGIPTTPLDSTLEMLINRGEIFRAAIMDLIQYAEQLVEPDYLTRSTSKILNIVETGIKAPQFKSSYTTLSATMLSHAQKMPSNSSFWQALSSAGSVFKECGDAQGEFVAQVREKFIIPLKLLLDIDYKNITKVHDDMTTTRYELDALKEKIKRGSDNPAVTSQFRKATSDFELLCVKLQTLLDSFCGAEGQDKLSQRIFVLLDICKNHHSECMQLFSHAKRP